MIPLAQQRCWLRRVQWISAGSTAILLAAFLVVVYFPFTHRASALQAEAESAQGKIRKNAATARDLDLIKADVDRLRAQILRSRQVPKQQDLPKFIRDVTQLSQSSQLQRFRYEPSTQKKQELCSELPITLQFSGPFPDVATFLRQAEEMPRMTRTRKLNLKCRDGKAGVVDVELSMSIFFSEDQ